MPSILVEYQLRIRNAADSADALVVTTVRGGTNPYLAGPPQGDGSSIDPLGGHNVAGSFTGQVIDAITGGSSRLLTSIMEDAGGGAQLGDRKAFWEFRQNGGAWVVLIAGFLTKYALSSDIVWDITVSDPFRVEREYTAFAPQIIDDAGTKRLETIAEFLARWPNRGCIFGGPIRGTGDPGETVFLGQKNLGGFEVQAAERSFTADGYGKVWLKFISGYGPPGFGRTTRARDVSDRINAVTTPMMGAGWYFPTDSIFTFDEAEKPMDFPGIVLELMALDGVTEGFYTVITPGGASQPRTEYPEDRYLQFMQGDRSHIGFWINDTASLSIGPLVHRARAFTARVSEVSPIYWSGHPADLLALLWTEAGVAYDTAAITTVKNQLGADLRIALRITAPQPLANFLEETIYGPFGIGVRTNALGEAEAICTRIFLNTIPAATLTDADVIQDETDPFSLDASTAIKKVVLEHYLLQLTQEVRAGPINFGVQSTGPIDGEYTTDQPDGIVVQKYTIERTNGDQGARGHGEQRYRIPGMVYREGSNTPDFAVQWFDTVAYGIFDRWGRGARDARTIAIRGGAGDSMLLGDEILVSLKQVPNHNKRIGDDGTVGARAMQILHRTPTLRGHELGLLDSGPNANAFATVPTLTIAASLDSPTTLAVATITNAAALNAASAGLRLQMAVTTGGAPALTDYTDVLVFAAGLIPTTAFRLPSVLAGRKVYVRARSEKSGTRPSNYSAGVSVTLSGLGAPSALAITPDTADGSQALVTWTIGTNAENADTDVYLRAQGAPASEAVRQIILPAGSTRHTLEYLTPGDSYTVGVQHRIRATGDVSAVTEDDFTADATMLTLEPPIVPNGFAGSLDPVTGVPQRDGVYGIAVLAAELPSFVEVQEALETAVGAGTYGSFATVDKVASIASGWTKWQGVAPNDGLRRQLKARHTRDGTTASAYTSTVTVLPWTPLALPPIPLPTLDVIPTESTTDVSFAFTSNADVDYRLDAGGWTDAGSSPLVIGRNASGGATKQVQIRASIPGQVPVVLTFSVLPQDASPPSRAFTGINAYVLDYSLDHIEVDWFITGFVSGDYFRLMRSRNGGAYGMIATSITSTFYTDISPGLTDDLVPSGGGSVTFDYEVEWYDVSNALQATSSVATVVSDTP